MQAVAILGPEEDARDAWAAMNGANAPWAAVFDEGRLVGVLNGGDLDAFLRAPETFRSAGEIAGRGMPARRGLSLSPDADLSEAVLRIEMAGADAAFVESAGPASWRRTRPAAPCRAPRDALLVFSAGRAWLPSPSGGDEREDRRWNSR